MLNFGVLFMADPPVSGSSAGRCSPRSNGFSHVWLWDSHVLWQEVYPIFTLMARRHSRISTSDRASPTR